MKHSTILGIDPDTREMGLALLRDGEPRYFGVRKLRDGARPHDAVDQAKQFVLAAIEEHQPQVVAIEQPFKLPTRRSYLLDAIADELRARAPELGLKVVRLAPGEIRRRVTGDPRATRVQVAEHLARSGLDEVSTLITSRAAGPTPGDRPREAYWLPMSGALAIALAARDVPMGRPAGRSVTGSALRPRGIDD